MDDELKEILREAFGDSSSDDDSDSSYEWRERLQSRDPIDEIAKDQSIFGESCCWEPITGVNGLWICRDFLSPDQQSSLLSDFEKGASMLNFLRIEMVIRFYDENYKCLDFCGCRRIFRWSFPQSGSGLVIFSTFILFRFTILLWWSELCIYAFITFKAAFFIFKNSNFGIIHACEMCLWEACATK